MHNFIHNLIHDCKEILKQDYWTVDRHLYKALQTIVFYLVLAQVCKEWYSAIVDFIIVIIIIIITIIALVLHTASLTKPGSTSVLAACFGNLSSGSARKPAATLPDSVLFGAPPPTCWPPKGSWLP